MRAQENFVVDQLRRARKIAALTGAGISTAAGIPDFRGPQGLYVTRRYDPERTFDISYFDEDPTYFFAFARDFIHLLDQIKPTFTHRFLAELEKAGRLDAVITQNIDGLHQRAGSCRVIEVHGSIRTGHCRSCGASYDQDAMKEMIVRQEVASCRTCAGVVKPDIVFFGEGVQGMHDAESVAAESDLLLVIGSSLTVYPAALLPRYAGGQVIIVNQGPVETDSGEWLHVNETADPFFAGVASALGMATS